MYKRNSTVKNAAWIISCRIAQSVLALIVSMLSARYLGPSNFGLINYAASVAAFALPIMQLGFNSTLVHEFVNNPDNEGEIMGTALLFNILSALVCFIGIGAFVYVANPGEKETFIVCILYSIMIFFQVGEMLQFWFQSKMMSQYTSVTSLIAYTVVSAYKIYLLVTQKSIYWFAVSQAIDYLIIFAVLLILYCKIANQRLRISFKRGFQMLSKSRFYIVSSLMVTIFAQTDKIMLKMMLGQESVGIYSAAVSTASMVAFVYIAILDSMRPTVFESKNKSQKLFEKNVSLTYSVIIYLSLAQCLIFAIFSPLIINILYGAQYSASASVLSVIVWYTTFSYLGSVRNIWMLAENQQKYLWIINLSGALANIALNAVLIPIMGTMGAAVASLITQIFTNVIIGFIIKPVRRNNYLMFKGLNPKPMIDLALGYIKKRK